jgi:predicted NAD/FAD-dependent oxidoreductase
VQEWAGKIMTLEPGKKPKNRIWLEPHYVAVPTMNSLCKALVDNIPIKLNCEIAPIPSKTNHGWLLWDKEGASYGPFDWVISTAPAPQTSALFEKITSQSVFSEYNYRSCYSLMLGFQSSWSQSWIAAKIMNSPLDWLSVNSSKPSRDKTVTSLVIHSSHLWTELHLNDDRAEVEAFLINELKALLKLDMGAPCYSSLHYWRYALINQAPEERNNTPYFLDPERRLASVGDWCHRSRVEDTWLNAQQLAIKIQFS